MNKKLISVLFFLLSFGLFAYSSNGKGDKKSDTANKYEKILRNVGIILEEGHYNPKNIDDAFSKQVFKKYMDGLDPYKFIFLQKDMDAFKKFKTKIDNEIHGSNLESFYAISSVYALRVDEITKKYKDILAKPFDFSGDENIIMDVEKLSYPKNEKERDDFIRRRIKYRVLSRYASMLDEREKNMGKPGYVAKPDSVLEQEARKQIIKQVDRFLLTFKNNNEPEDIGNMFSDFVNAVTRTMDPHTTYYTPVSKRSRDESLSGHYYGIGITIKEEDGKIKVTSLTEGGAAWKSGNIQVDDEILKIGQGGAEPVGVTGYTIADVTKLTKSPEKNSEIRLTIKKADGSEIVVSLLREDISVDAKSAIINGRYKIGYIYLPKFYKDSGRGSATDVAREIEKLKAQNVDGIVMDLRNNSGGYQSEVIDIAGLFIGDGPVFQVKQRNRLFPIEGENEDIKYSGALAVIVNDLTASASEVFTAAIQDYNRGVIIGSSSTYGKGTIQRALSLDTVGLSRNAVDENIKKVEGLGYIDLTYRKFYRINGGATQLRGITPDVVLPDKSEYLKRREKDSPNALSWDEISKASYDEWKPGYNLNTVVRNADEQINNNAAFKSIREDVKWVGQNINKQYSLNLNKFRVEQKKIRATLNELDSLIKLPVNLNVINLSPGVAKITEGKNKTQENQQLLQKINDVYIEQTINVLNSMIEQAAISKSNK